MEVSGKILDETKSAALETCADAINKRKQNTSVAATCPRTNVKILACRLAQKTLETTTGSTIVLPSKTSTAVQTADESNGSICMPCAAKPRCKGWRWSIGPGKSIRRSGGAVVKRRPAKDATVVHHPAMHTATTSKLRIVVVYLGAMVIQHRHVSSFNERSDERMRMTSQLRIYRATT
jgi:hypothetical protein